MDGPDHAWLDRLEAEHDNLRAAMLWQQGRSNFPSSGSAWPGRLAFLGDARARARGTPVAGRGNGQGGRRPLGLRARALNAAGNLARDAADFDESTALHEEGLSIGGSSATNWASPGRSTISA